MGGRRGGRVMLHFLVSLMNRFNTIKSHHMLLPCMISLLLNDVIIRIYTNINMINHQFMLFLFIVLNVTHVIFCLYQNLSQSIIKSANFRFLQKLSVVYCFRRDCTTYILLPAENYVVRQKLYLRVRKLL